MPNINQNNKIRTINKEKSIAQDSLKRNKKSLSQYKVGLRKIGRLRVKQGQKANLFKTKKVQEAFRDIFSTKIKTIKKKNKKCPKKKEII